MGLFSKSKTENKVREPVDFSKILVPETKREEVITQPPVQQMIDFNVKLDNTLSFIYDSITDNKIELDNFEWSTKISDTKKLIVKIETL